MTRDEALQKLGELRLEDDREKAHSRADDILCELLADLGFRDVVDAYGLIPKWYA